MQMIVYCLFIQKFSYVKVDKVVVKAKHGRFAIKRLYGELKSRMEVDFPSKMIWNAWVPPKVGNFSWEEAWSKI